VTKERRLPAQGSHASWEVLDSLGFFFLENSRTWKNKSNTMRRAAKGKIWTDSSQSGAGQQAPGTKKTSKLLLQSLYVYRDHL